ncbi:MAG TPA: STAS domain-containing protein [Gallionella sp.]|nr:STAS domain-containing protein [Gallionella sp.]
MRVSRLLKDDTATVYIAGRFDATGYRQFRDVCDECLRLPEVVTLDVDVSGVEHFNSTALGMLILVRAEARKWGKALRLSNPDELTWRVLELANFHRLFAIVR